MNKREFNSKLNKLVKSLQPLDEYDDLIYAIHNNSGPNVAEIDGIVLQITGENDVSDWHWIVKMKDGSFGYGHGGCDYTGWDCQSSFDWHPAATAFEAIQLADEQIRMEFEQMVESGTSVR
jgi:hypothetical protein